MMSSALSKRQQQKNEKQLHELLKVPGNNVCADCGGKNPSWASWSLGIFLCVRCAALHRKLGTHISKVKSISLDTWTNDQVENMRKTGNIASNAVWNPDPVKNQVPLNADESDSVMERFLRLKYEQGKFRRDGMASNSANGSSSQRDHLSPTSTGGAGIVRQPSPGLDKSFTLQEFSKFRSKSPAPEPKASRVLGINGSVDIVPPEWEAKVLKLKDMGFPDAKRSVQVLRSVNGNLEQAVEILIRVSGASSPVPPPKDKPVVKKTATPSNAAPAKTQQSLNPFDALDLERPQQQQQQQQLNVPQQIPLQQTLTGPGAMSNPFNQQGYVNQGFQGGNQYQQFQQQPQQIPQQFQSPPQQLQQPQQMQHPQQAQQQIWGAEPSNQQQFNQVQYQQPQLQQNTGNPFLQSYSNPYAPQQQQQQPTTQVSQAPFQQPTMQPQIQSQQQFSQPQYHDPSQLFAQQQQQFPYQQPQQQQQVPQQQQQFLQQQQQPFLQQQQPFPQQQGYPQSQQLQPLFQQRTGRVDKNTIMALYNYPQFAPTPNQTQQPVQETPKAPEPTSNVPAPPPTGSNNPFQNRPSNGARHNSQESVDFGAWQSGRHSPDAFASLSASFRQ